MKTSKNINTENLTGIITYKNYDENVIIDNNFDVQGLWDIIEKDKDFVKFEMFKNGVSISVEYSQTIKDNIELRKQCIDSKDFIGRILIENKLDKYEIEYTPSYFGTYLGV